MKVSEFITTAELAIRSNLRIRNAKVFGGTGAEVRNARRAAAIRWQVREWVAALRVARDPRNHDLVQQELGVDVLMGHDLRRRVITVGFDGLLQHATQTPQERPRG